MKKKLISVAMLGYTGAVGGQSLQALLNNTKVSKLTLLGRRKINIMSVCEVSTNIVDIHNASTYTDILTGTDSAICTLGVGQPSKVSKEELLRVDKDAVMHFARACKVAGVKHFQLLGSVSASAKSYSFYLKTKGDLVDELKLLGFQRLSVFQPSMILTPKNRYGFSQWLTLKLWPVLSYLLIGKLSKFKGIKVKSLGQAIAANLFTEGNGVEYLHFNDFIKLSK